MLESPARELLRKECAVAEELTVDLVTGLFHEGVEAVGLFAAGLTGDAWELPACGRWTGTETSRHLVAVVRWYHDWLDRAIAGDASPPFPESEMDEQNEAALRMVPDLSGREAVAEFTAGAASYLNRAVQHWDVPFGYPSGTVTVGLHCGIAATEWHLHAWDLSHTSERRHRPRNPEALFTAAAMCVAEAKGGLGGAVLRLLVPLGARRNPWSTIVKRSGRTPDDRHRR